MRITKKQIKDRVGSFRMRRIKAEMIGEIQSCATSGQRERLEALLWALGFHKVRAQTIASEFLDKAATPEPPPVDRAALRKQQREDARVEQEQKKLALWTGQ